GAGAVTLGNAANPMPIALAGNQTWSNASSNLMTVVNSVAIGNNALTASGSGNTSLAGAISGGTLIQSGPGLLSFVAVGSNYTGPTIISGGVLQLGTYSLPP